MKGIAASLIAILIGLAASPASSSSAGTEQFPAAAVFEVTYDNGGRLAQADPIGIVFSSAAPEPKPYPFPQIYLGAVKQRLQSEKKSGATHYFTFFLFDPKVPNWTGD